MRGRVLAAIFLLLFAVSTLLPVLVSAEETATIVIAQPTDDTSIFNTDPVGI